MIILVVSVYLVIALVQMPALIKEKHWRDLIAFSFFTAAACTLSLLYILGSKIPSPFIAVHKILDILHLHY
jgi:hypothetical protein